MEKNLSAVSFFVGCSLLAHGINDAINLIVSMLGGK